MGQMVLSGSQANKQTIKIINIIILLRKDDIQYKAVYFPTLTVTVLSNTQIQNSCMLSAT